jgi:hypothetical protein
MDADLVKTKLVEVLTDIQATSGLECPLLSGGTKPIDELPKFDSKIWPVATGMLATGLGITIPNDVNIFRPKKDGPVLTIDETVALVVKLAEAQASAPSVPQAVNA